VSLTASPFAISDSWVFGYANYDALKRRCKGGVCRGEEHEIEFQSIAYGVNNSKKNRVLHNGRILIEEVVHNPKENFEHDFVIKGKNHDAKVLVLGGNEVDLSFGGLPFVDLPQTFEIQQNILSLYVAVPRKRSSKHDESSKPSLDKEDDSNPWQVKREETQEENGRHRKKERSSKYKTKKPFSITQNKEPRLHKLLEGSGDSPKLDKQKSDPKRVFGLTGDRPGADKGFCLDDDLSTKSDPDNDSAADKEDFKGSKDEENSKSNGINSEEAYTEEWIQESLFLNGNEIDENGSTKKGDGWPRAYRSNSFVSISSAGSSFSLVSLTDNEEEEDGGRFYLDRSTLGMFDSSEDSTDLKSVKSLTSRKQDDDKDDDASSVSTCNSSIAGRMADLNVDDMLARIICAESSDDDSSEGNQGLSQKGGVPNSISMR
jgi:hypothetical protein